MIRNDKRRSHFHGQPVFSFMQKRNNRTGQNTKKPIRKLRQDGHAVIDVHEYNSIIRLCQPFWLSEVDSHHPFFGLYLFNHGISFPVHLPPSSSLQFPPSFFSSAYITRQLIRHINLSLYTQAHTHTHTHSIRHYSRHDYNYQ